MVKRRLIIILVAVAASVGSGAAGLAWSHPATKPAIQHLADGDVHWLGADK